MNSCIANTATPMGNAPYIQPENVVAQQQLKQSLQQTAFQLQITCQSALQHLGEAIGKEHADAYSDNNGLFGWFISNQSYHANMNAAQAVNQLQPLVSQVNNLVMQLRGTGLFLSSITVYFNGSDIAQAENAEHSFTGRIFDFFTGTNVMDHSSSIRTLQVLNNTQAAIQQIQMQTQNLLCVVLEYFLLLSVGNVHLFH